MYDHTVLFNIYNQNHILVNYNPDVTMKLVNLIIRTKIKELDKVQHLV